MSVNRIIHRANKPMKHMPTRAHFVSGRGIRESDYVSLLRVCDAYRRGAHYIAGMMIGVSPGLVSAIDGDVELPGMDWCAVERMLAEYYSIPS